MRKLTGGVLQYIYTGLGSFPEKTLPGDLPAAGIGNLLES